VASPPSRVKAVKKGRCLRRDRPQQLNQAIAIATLDPLTELPNRTVFNERLAGRLDANNAVVLIDLDHFKEVNDTLGHAVGDDCSSRSANGFAPPWPNPVSLRHRSILRIPGRRESWTGRAKRMPRAGRNRSYGVPVARHACRSGRVA